MERFKYLEFLEQCAQHVVRGILTVVAQALGQSGHTLYCQRHQHYIRVLNKHFLIHSFTNEFFKIV